MTVTRIEFIATASDPRIEAIGALVQAMYDEMQELGPLVPLATNGARIWLDGISTGLERFGRLCIAIKENEVVGFAHGAVKLLPEHQGGARIGHITHVHVMPAHRRSGIARELVASLDAWFNAKGVVGTEIHIVVGNEQAKAFWTRLGYMPELIQYARRG
jgi:ribosomal protein S18 acetylase RimI-like enzyme